MNFEPHKNLLWQWAIFVPGCWVAGQALGMFNSVFVEKYGDIGLAITISGVPCVILSGFFVNIMETNKFLYGLSFINPLRFVF